jgi:DNA-binding transcriptional ArsR family regulator
MATKGKRRQAGQNRLEAMRHPLRREALMHLIEHGVASPVEIAEALGVATSDVSYHVRRLEILGCAELVKEEKVRGAVKHYYRAIERHLVDTDEWEEIDPLIREGLLVDFYQPAVDDFTRSAKAGILGADEKFHITRTPLAGMDREGLDEALEAFEECRLKIVDIQTRSTARQAKSEKPPICISSSLSCFEVPHF